MTRDERTRIAFDLRKEADELVTRAETLRHAADIVSRHDKLLDTLRAIGLSHNYAGTAADFVQRVLTDEELRPWK